MHEIYRQLPFLCLQVSLVHAALPQPLIQRRFQRWPCLLCALQSVLMTKMRYICYETSKKDLTNLVISGNDLIMEEFVFVAFGAIISVVYGLL